MLNKDIHLCSFASPDLFLSRNRFLKESKKINFYKSIKVFNQKNLSIELREFIKKCRKNNEYTGYGYWYWKPFIVLEFLKSLPKNSIVHYCDIGCVYKNTPKVDIGVLDNLFNLCQEKDMIAFNYSPPKNIDKKYISPILTEKQFTKNDLFEYYDIDKYSKIRNSPQFSAGFFFIKNCQKSYDFLEMWMKPFKDNKKLVDNSPSASTNSKEFITQRHDQSIFSLLCKKNSIFSLSAYDYYEPSYFKNSISWLSIDSSPFHMERKLLYVSYRKIKNFIKKKLKI